MSQPERVLIIGGKKNNIRKAKALGLEVLYIQKRALFQESHLDYADHTFLVDYADLSVLLPLARGIHEALPFRYVISMTEPGLLPAAHVNDALGLPGNSVRTVTLLKDKWAMRQHLNPLGISPVAAARGSTREELDQFARRHGLPLIVKPVDGTGSVGILLAREPGDLEALWQQMAELGLPAFIIEEYLDGPEISVEGFTFGGRHVVVAMTDKLTLPNFVEIGHSVPSQISPALQEEVERLVCAMLDAVGLKEGPSHTEVKLTARGPRIVESHNRMGGDKISELVRVACGVDLVELSFAWPYGLAGALPAMVPVQAGAAVRFFTPRPGVVKEIRGADAVRIHPQVAELELPVQVGSRVRCVRQSGDRSGHLLVRGRDVREAIELCEELAGRVAIVTEAGDA